jgi:hypothetical protein
MSDIGSSRSGLPSHGRKQVPAVATASDGMTGNRVSKTGECLKGRQPLLPACCCQAFIASSNTLAPGMPFSIVKSARRPDLY